MLAGAGRRFTPCPPTNKRSAEVATSAAHLLRRRQTLSELVLSSGERVSHRSCASGNSLCSCERMLAGAGRGCAGCPPKNESSAEVTISYARLLRRGQPLRELVPSSGERRKWLLRPLLSSGEGMLAEGRSVAGGRTSVKPPWSEVMIFLGVFLRQGTPLQEETLIGRQTAPEKSPPARECSPEESAWWAAELRRSRRGRR